MDNCSVSGCTRNVRSNTAVLCEMHYYRLRRTGEVGPGESVKRKRATCRHEHCARLDSGSHGWCSMHARRVALHGHPDTVLRAVRTPLEAHPQWKGDDVSYSGMHMRLRAMRGSARHLTCVDCGEKAAHWSYDHKDPNERSSEYGAYSTDANHYSPRCVSCHKSYDLAVI